jgi:hypothetical protein
MTKDICLTALCSDESNFVGLASHSCLVTALLRIIGHRESKPKAGDISLVFVKREGVRQET